MPGNDVLRDALIAAQLTYTQVADRTGVDEKTVCRWVTEGRVPHQPTRLAVAKLLGEDPEMLWSEAVRRRFKTGADRELVEMYARRADVPRHFWRDMITSARRRILFGGYTSYFIFVDAPQARAQLAAKAGQGVDVRWLLGDPDSAVTRARDDIEAHPLKLATRIQMTRMEIAKSGAADLMPVRLSDRHIATSVWIFDDEAVLATHIGAGLGHDSLTQHFRRREEGGPFDRLLEHFESLWNDAHPAEPETDT